MSITFENHVSADSSAGRFTRGASVVVVEREAVFRAALRNVLSRECGFDVVAETGSGQEAGQLMRAHSPQIVLMELELARAAGLHAHRWGGTLPRPPKLVLFGTAPGAETLDAALEAGALGFVTRTLDTRLLEAVLRHVLTGGCAIGADVFDGLMGSEDQRPVPRFLDHHHKVALLNESERRVLRLLGHGLDNSRIAAELHLSRTSVKTYVSRILGKLHLENRTQAALVANETGLVEQVRMSGRAGPGQGSELAL
ncbi:response regulator transcription factor [Streptomyces sp. WZ-12]|uniref:response regulator transcription factor n=1 Tax=Streptomyces sp. WZ-12 TaxID=3030210 RepID=UPI0023813917|nr:response regulator transcription factor [Streptomyces sp. WZ-12]